MWLRSVCPTDKLTLTEEIKLFTRYISLTPNEQELRQISYQKVSQLLTNRYPGCEVTIYGSYVSGFSLPSSDIDLVLSFSEEVSKNQVKKLLFKISTICRSSKFLRVEDVITNAKVPIIKLLDLDTTISIDLSINCEGGIDSSALTHSLLTSSQFTQEIALFVKYLVFQNNLNEPYHGGIGSYAIVLLTATFLKFYPQHSLGRALVEFLNFYGNIFKMGKTGVSYQHGFFSLVEKNLFEEDSLVIEDPCDEGNNVGRSSFKFNAVQFLFKKTLMGINLIIKNPEGMYLPSGSRLAKVVAIPKSLQKYREAIDAVKSEQKSEEKTEEKEEVEVMKSPEIYNEPLVQ
ncbi:PAP-associated domain containing protein, putative [Entamoeba invadens IP1]|uniref:PAP-associated domain containing protein, putative n=1 Tax=Entamoeba invadens IP1 TaxID=370355 RepID=A0A0A1U510_ENTIV|nr:PAP-associated domain containing protein, putative [Entamoeba invadens IP1]ELP89279.1 PAP-associated domain containing protein, putative [Entamoeba invadens IP1]|eukprot:XP_004256050.1 PAP-associated domain containing protein, putative [Entamoeba invadens IP1]